MSMVVAPRPGEPQRWLWYHPAISQVWRLMPRLTSHLNTNANAVNDNTPET